MVKTQTNRARGELLSVVLVTGCVYMRATVCVCYTTTMSASILNKYTVHIYLHINAKYTVYCILVHAQ